VAPLRPHLNAGRRGSPKGGSDNERERSPATSGRGFVGAPGHDSLPTVTTSDAIFREQAEYCKHLSARAPKAVDKAFWLRLAAYWLELADQNRPKQANR
jgi:hypothetical protein